MAALVHAAALSGAWTLHVQEWLSDPDTHGPIVERYLQRSPSKALEQDAIQFFAPNHTSRSSITTSAMPAWLSGETAAACAQPVNAATLAGIERILAGRRQGPIELDIEYVAGRRAVF